MLSAFLRPRAVGRLLSVCTALAAYTPSHSPAWDIPVWSSPSRDTRDTVTAFVNVGVIPMDSERVLLGQTVLVQGSHITALGPVGHVQVPSGAVRIDGQGKFLIPGLADMHVHVAFAGDSVRAAQYLFRRLAEGVTTIRDMDYYHDGDMLDGADLLRLRARAAAGAIASPRIYTSGSWAGATAGRATDAAAAIPAYKAAGYDFIKVRNEDLVTFDSVAAAARRVGIPFAGHLAGGMTVAGALAAGYKSIEHLDGYIATLQGATHEDTAAGIRAIAVATQRAGVWNCPTMVIDSMLVGFGPAAVVSGSRVVEGSGGTLDVRRWIVKALQDAGAGLLLGTDDQGNHTSEQMISVHAELQALVGAGLTPYQALAAGTRNVAAYFGTLDQSGTVAVGKRADLVLLSGNPLVDIQHAAQIDGVMVNGRWFPRAELDRSVADTTSGK